MNRIPSKERGCTGKMNVGRDYRKTAEKFARKNGKSYGVYYCPHCGGNHLTTKVWKADEYGGLLYVTGGHENAVKKI